MPSPTHDQIAAAVAAAQAERSKALSALVAELPRALRRTYRWLIQSNRGLRPKHSHS